PEARVRPGDRHHATRRLDPGRTARHHGRVGPNPARPAPRCPSRPAARRGPARGHGPYARRPPAGEGERDEAHVQLPGRHDAGPGSSDNLMLDFLSGMTAQAVQQRFQMSIFKEDANYVYLDIKPVLGKDKQEFEHVRFALYGPKVPAPFTPYLPVEMWVKKP